MKDMKKLIRVLQYVRGTFDFGIKLEVVNSFSITAFVDASYGVSDISKPSRFRLPAFPGRPGSPSFLVFFPVLFSRLDILADHDSFMSVSPPLIDNLRCFRTAPQLTSGQNPFRPLADKQMIF